MTDTQQNSTADETTPAEPQEGTSEAVNEQEGAPTPDESQNAPEGDSEAPEDTPSEDDDTAGDGDPDELPEWGRKQLQKARKDAANYRTKFAEANEKLSKATSPDDFEAVKKELAAAKLELDTERIANRYGLPEEMRQVLAGKTTEEVEAHAKILSKFVPAQGFDIDGVSGGLNPGDDDEVVDPRALAARHRRR